MRIQDTIYSDIGKYHDELDSQYLAATALQANVSSRILDNKDEYFYLSPDNILEALTESWDRDFATVISKNLIEGNHQIVCDAISKFCLNYWEKYLTGILDR